MVCPGDWAPLRTEGAKGRRAQQGSASWQYGQDPSPDPQRKAVICKHPAKCQRCWTQVHRHLLWQAVCQGGGLQELPGTGWP